MKSFSIIVLSVALAGCASKAADVQPSYVSPVAYSSYTCQQLSEEAARVSAHAAELAGVEDKKASDDAVTTGVAVVLFWPAAFMLNGNSQVAAQLASLKGQRDAVEQASIQKNCGITFQHH